MVNDPLHTPIDSRQPILWRRLENGFRVSRESACIPENRYRKGTIDRNGQPLT